MSLGGGKKGEENGKRDIIFVQYQRAHKGKHKIRSWDGKKNRGKRLELSWRKDDASEKEKASQREK